MKYEHSEFLLEEFFRGSYARNRSITKFADQGWLEGIGEKAINAIKSAYDPAEPLLSIEKFFASGALWSLNPLLGVVYMILEMMDFPFDGFFRAINNGVGSIFNGIKKGAGLDNNSAEDNLPNEEAILNSITSVVNKAVNSFFQDNSPEQPSLSDYSKIKEKLNAANHFSLLKKFAITYQVSPNIIKRAGWISSLLGKPLKGFLVSIISWIWGKFWISLGLTAAAGGVAGALGSSSPRLQGQPGSQQDQSNPNNPNNPTSQNQRQLMQKLQTPDNIPYNITEYHENSIGGLWLERGRLQDIKSILMSWIVAVFPQLKNHQEEIENSSAFQNVYQEFMNRNRMSQGENYFTVPHPYDRKLDIVSKIVNGLPLNEYQGISEENNAQQPQ